MKLRLVHQLSLLMLCAVILGLVLMAAAIGWNLRAGFVDYLEARDAERLERFVAIAQGTLGTRGMQSLESPDGLRGLLDQLARVEGLPAAAPDEADEAPPPPPTTVTQVGNPPQASHRPPRPRFDEPPDPWMRPRRPWPPHRPGDERGPPPPHDRPPPDAAPPPRKEPATPPAAEPARPVAERPRPPRRRPPPPETHTWGKRLAIEDASGRVLAGHARATQLPSLTRPIELAGQPVATARLYLASQIPEGVETRFLSRQYGAIAALTLILAVVSILASILIARRWLRPIREVQNAAQRLARGEFQLRLPAGSEDELGELTRHMNMLAASLEKLETARRRWVAELSHELRTPLAVLRGELEAMQDGIRPMDQKSLASLLSEVGHITRLIDDLHQLAMFDLEKMPCRFSAVDAVELIEQAIERVRPKADSAGIALHARHPRGLQAVWDAGRITQLLGNLLENSIKYTDAPGRIHVLLEGDDAQATIMVEDTPPGVRDFELGAMFEPLYRADPSRNRKQGGSGLGLAICESIVRAHGGSIRAQPSDLGGIAIVVTLPLRPS